jgi:hypothetical protein
MGITNMTNADYDPVFKRNYLKLGDNLYNTFDNVHSRHKKTFGTLGGADSRHPVETTFGGGFGGSSDGYLPVANNTAFIQPVYTAKRTYARINIDNMTIESSAKNEWSFVRAIDQETTGKLRNFNRNHARILMNDGSGVLGEFTGPAGGTAAAPTMTILTTGNYGRRHACFEKGEYVQVNSLGSLFEIRSYVRSSGLLTLARKTGSDDLTGLAVATHKLYTQGSKDTEPYGYLGVLINSSHYGVAEEHRWQPLEINASSAPLDTEMLTQLVEQSSELNDQAFTDLIFSPYQYRKYISLLEDQKRFPVPVDVKPRPNKMTSPDLIAKVSFGGIQYVGSMGNINCFQHRFLRDDLVIGINTNEAELRHVKKPGWAARDNTVFLRMADYDGYEARYVCYSENCINPFYAGFIYGLATS